ncbi:glycoside hydrolase family 3 C-terminal domain-containing protein [Chromohalobacter sp. HP20-39]|uniref:glycoside hydrolase family 3 C-terminal domain-containing protein n=1 Tax=Chromohalobacter sp. HP20-39 TaxID=3079306 RepID=UPI00294AC0E4|nr:glycoside hydrolase family 3 C-terminal domain-containing protein [Chromohalobacter sp. HP20-39]MDV6319117.1 glycoside hydrolase family 3 C-terminal domain-containing protein [Chromohalobacter sp. HP20-39]
MNTPVETLIARMTLEEKASLCSGADFWHTKAVERLDIPSIMMSDGPHGLRKQPNGPGEDHLGLLDSVPATCFPTAAGLASSWDPALLRRLGEALGQEAQAEGLGIVLGPGANIKRSPLCGRNFEYFSEDPLLSSTLAAAHIEGVQSQGVGASLKHFAANNQEHRRMSVDAQIDERTLREIYLESFEKAVREARPWTVMCAYNKVNGTYCAEHEKLLTEILRDEWGFDGFVVSDWAAVNERVAGLAAGLELEMPATDGDRDRLIVEAVRSGELAEAVLDRAVHRLLTIILRAHEAHRPQASYDAEAHHQLAREVARECMVLLQNDGTLPLVPTQRIAVIGEFAAKPRYQGGGSSHVNPTRVETPLEALRATVPESLSYAQGFAIAHDFSDAALLEEAVAQARGADVVVLFIGLPERYESEGYDRSHLDLPANQKALIEAVSEVQPRTVVVLANGAPIMMPWASRVAAILEGYLGGQALGAAIADLLFGAVSPSGKLAETFPQRLEDTPSYLSFPGEGDVARYSEGLFVGYRHYDSAGVAPLFPFGHGLSYTRFTYGELSLSSERLGRDETLTISFDLTNSGERAGKEVVQLYLHDSSCTVPTPDQALKAFTKLALEPGETHRVALTLTRRDFAYYDVEQQRWCVPTGAFEIRIGASSRDIRLTRSVEVEGDPRPLPTIDRNTLIGDLSDFPQAREYIHEALAPVAGDVPLLAAMQGSKEDEASEMMTAMWRYSPLRALISFSGGSFNEVMLEQLLVRLKMLK